MPTLCDIAASLQPLRICVIPVSYKQDSHKLKIPAKAFQTPYFMFGSNSLFSSHLELPEGTNEMY